ncbi:glycogen debranching protein [Robiginitalea aurantiaca]|uniref:Glycogen debranching protein n=1 Tax=Robiginitalea aurantiaca TaxID=3056915 RepID=A0ABT7WEH2_9FLAO|nr:glycogen debranching protein [Robiginitalea aurantiaca]MDM9631326.1 glycogen debranching protein [Robiginitalea aurantiaca]
MNRYYLYFLLACAILSCSREVESMPLSIGDALKDSPHIQGTDTYLSSPYVTAGDRLYMVGHQDGSFPELGWHIKGEMGGVWNHPIKLLDGFEATLVKDNNRIPLEKATAFFNYPMANLHKYMLEDMPLEIDRWQFVPDGEQGIVVQYVFRNTSNSSLSYQFEFTGYSDLRPTWLGERSGMEDNPDIGTFEAEAETWIIKDIENPWYVVFGADLPVRSHRETEGKYKGLGKAAMLEYRLEIPAEESQTVTFVIAGSYTSESEARSTYSNLKQNKSSLLQEKSNRYKDLASRSKLTTPDSTLNQTFEWLKYNCDWLVRDVPEIGRGITAGIPDYPWWFGVDSEYALQGYMAVGQRDIVHETIRLIDSVSEAINGNGRIIHEMSTNGVVFNKGNINETPQFATLIWRIYQWNGEDDFLRKYFPTVRKGLEWLMSENDGNQNGFPDGFGMMEIHGLDSEMIDVATYTQAAFSDASKIAAVLGETALSNAYRETASDLREKINSAFWSDEFQSYADFLGTDQQALHLIGDAIIRADTLNKPWAVTELEKTRDNILNTPTDYNLKPFVLHHNWVVNTPMEMGIAEPDKAKLALETARNFVNPYGMFVTGIDRDESAGSDASSFEGSKVFSYTGAVMTLPTGVQAIAENNYGRPEQALDYLKRMTRSFSYALPGSMYEVSPDYGMIVQAWNIYSFAIPIIGQFFGIQPMVAQKEITVSPMMPPSWNEARLENVLVADNAVSVYYHIDDLGRTVLKVSQEKEDWTLKLKLEGVRKSNFEILEGKVQEGPADADVLELIGRGAVIEVRYTKG